MFCPNCGNKLSKTAKFCGICGKSIESESRGEFRQEGEISEKSEEIIEETKNFEPQTAAVVKSGWFETLKRFFLRK